jgi:hypothetical protein
MAAGIVHCNSKVITIIHQKPLAGKTFRNIYSMV